MQRVASEAGLFEDFSVPIVAHTVSSCVCISSGMPSIMATIL